MTDLLTRICPACDDELGRGAFDDGSPVCKGCDRAETYTGEAHTVRAIADRLGIPQRQVCSWAVAWHGLTGQGRPRRLDFVDVLVARAWLEMGGACTNRPGYYGHVADRYRHVETAIRSEPRQWLLLAGHLAETFDTAEAATRAWLDSGQPAGQIIDLCSVPEARGE